MKKSLLRRILRIWVWVVGSLVGLLLLVMCAIAWILTPERLTPLVEKYASDYLLADLKAGRIELTVWKSFPYVELDATDIHLISRIPQSQPDSVKQAMGKDASRLADAKSIHASLNPWHLLRGVIHVGDVSVKGLGANLVAYSSEVANYLIVPPSEPSESEPMRFEFDKIEISSEGGIRYFDVASKTDVLLNRPMLTATGDGDHIGIDFKTPLAFSADGHRYLNGVPVTMNADLLFKQDPMSLASDNFVLTLWGLPVNLKFGLDLGDKPALTLCNIDIPPLKVMPLLRMAAPELLELIPELKGLDTDLSLGAKATVECPWAFDSPVMPDVLVSYEIPACRLAYSLPGVKEKLDINPLTLSGTFRYDGANPAASVVDIPLFTAEGDGINLSLTARVEEALSDDPLLRLTSKGSTDVSHFASLIPIPGTILKGTVNADASLICRMSDITEQRWQNLNVNGRVEMQGLLFSLPVMATKFYAGLATITLGNEMAHNDVTQSLVPGMLRAQVDIDTVYCGVPGITVGMRSVDLKAGTTPSLLAAAKTNDIMPLGMKLTAGRIKANSSVDTMTVVARNMTATGSITRYQGNARSPLMQAEVVADRLRYTDPFTRLSIKNASADVAAHLRERRAGGRGRHKGGHSAVSPENVVDLSVDDGLKALIRKWGVEGGLRADRVNLTYISYPVRMRLTNLALDFNLDSLHLHRAYLSSQNNRLSLAGTVAGMRSAMLGRNRRPLRIRMTADIDSLDINQIAYNYELGLGMMAKRGMLARISPEDEDALVRAAAETAAAPAEAIDTMPFLIPRNIDARVHLSAKEALYTNLAVRDVEGMMIMNDGALSLDSLTMSTDFGNAFLNLLYSSRDVNDLNMAVDFGFNRINLENFYTSFPALVEMMPVITNLHGMVGVGLTGSFGLTPTMDIDMGSINAVLNITGTDLTLSQDPMIRKIARMMLIRKNGPLNISDMNIQVSVHDNVMRLYPFAFSMEKYKFALLGENDLDQNMYYHLSVLKSPIPWKFGINIKGTFEHPKFRFGGPKYKENQAREVVNLVQTERVNFVRAMRLQLHNLIGRAALDYSRRNEPDESAERRDQSMTDTEMTDPTQAINMALSEPLARVLGKNADLLKRLQQEEKGKKGKKK